MSNRARKKRILRMVRRSKRRRHGQQQWNTTQHRASVPDTQQPSEEAKWHSRSSWFTYIYKVLPFRSTEPAGNQDDISRCKGCKGQTSKVQSLSSKVGSLYSQIRQQKEDHKTKRREFMLEKQDLEQQIREKNEIHQQDKLAYEQQIRDRDERIRMLETQLDEANRRVELAMTLKGRFEHAWRICVSCLLKDQMSAFKAGVWSTPEWNNQSSSCPRSGYEASGWSDKSSKQSTTDMFSQFADNVVNEWIFDEQTLQVMSQSTEGLVSRSRTTSESTYEVKD